MKLYFGLEKIVTVIKNITDYSRVHLTTYNFTSQIEMKAYCTGMQLQ